MTTASGLLIQHLEEHFLQRKPDIKHKKYIADIVEIYENVRV